MIEHINISNDQLRTRIRKKMITMGGNRNLKIYGLLNCASGKRMKKKHRVFFIDSIEAIHHGYRPCGHCLGERYNDWKSSQTQQ